MVVPETYLNDVPVPPEEGEQLARIKLSVEVISILELSEVDAIMTLQYREERINFIPGRRRKGVKTLGWLET